MRVLARYSAILLALLLLCIGAYGQAVTGTLTGNVTTEGTPVPGVTVTISSPALQGARVTVTNVNGAYNFPALPPGDYTVSFELEGMDVVTKKVTVSLTQTARADAAMGVATMAEMITVEASAPTALETTAVSTNFTAETIDNLPVNRTLQGAVDLAPGVSDTGTGGQPSISGAPTYNNLYMINGAVVNETLRGQPLDVYIEDAIEETTVLTGNISAEYGRFTGGVISALTKSGGNEFSGSFRTSITNDDWTRKTPYEGEADHLDKNLYVYEATLGGRVIRDRLWFFGAGRQNETSESRQMYETDIPYVYTNSQDRWELKLTGQLTPKHSLVASYLDRKVDQANYRYGRSVDLDSLDDRTLPYKLRAASYNGILTTNFLLEAQYSETGIRWQNSGSNYTDIVKGTILRETSRNLRGNSPTFCGVCDDETRDNEYLVAKGTYFLSTSGLGNHNLVAGLEDFSELRFSNNHQGGSGYRIRGDFLFNGQNFWFHIMPGGSSSTYRIENWPILVGSETNRTRTSSFFVNDKWDLNANWSFNLGLRYDSNDGEDSVGVKQSNDSGFSHRVGAVYDIFGDGRHRVNVGINRYISSVDNGVIDSASPGGNPAYFYYRYEGPEYNGGGCENDGTCLPNHTVIQNVFDWFFANVNELTDWYSADVPGVSSQINGQLQSPYMDEYSIGYGVQLGSRGYLRADFIDRTWSNFYVDVTNLGTGTVVEPITGEEFDLTLIKNSSGYHTRDYQGIQLTGSYRFTDRLNMGGNYTWSENKGTAEGETTSSGTVTLTSDESYPEYIDLSWNNPNRYLSADVRHRASLWISYDQPLGAFGSLNFSWLERYRTGAPYYSNGSVDLRVIENPGYVSPPTSATYYFEGNKDYRAEDVHRSDLGINYSLPIGPVDLFVQADVLNIFDESAVEDPTGIRQTIYTSTSSSCRQGSNGPNPGARCLTFNPLTETPVEGIHWQKRSDFGQPTTDGAYQLPLTYRFSVGLRF